MNIIALNTAKLAKDCGFNVKSDYFYNRGSGYKLQNDLMLRCSNDIIIEAPKQSELQCWLRNEYNIIVLVDFWVNDMFVCKIKYDNNATFIHDDIKTKEFNSYEDALENGLYNALMIVKLGL